MRKVIRGTAGLEKVVYVDEFDSDKTYFCRTSTGLYKLHCVSSYWAFLNLENSIGTSAGCFSGVTDAIKYQMEYGNVYEFDTLKEAMEEML